MKYVQDNTYWKKLTIPKIIKRKFFQKDSVNVMRLYALNRWLIKTKWQEGFGHNRDKLMEFLINKGSPIITARDGGAETEPKNLDMGCRIAATTSLIMINPNKENKSDKEIDYRGMEIVPLIIRVMEIPSKTGTANSSCALAEIREVNMGLEILPPNIPRIHIMDSSVARKVVISIRDKRINSHNHEMIRGPYSSCGKGEAIRVYLNILDIQKENILKEREIVEEKKPMKQ